nr:flagellar hook-length control protein FliK [Caulobacter segnis]
MAAQAKAADAVAVETAQAVTAVAAGSAGAGGETTTDGKGSDNNNTATVAAIDAPAATAAVADTNALAAPAPAVQAQAASASAPAAAPAPVRGSPETVAALSAEIIKKADAKTTRFDVALTPEGLGKVDVRIEIGRDGALTASMKFDTVHAAQELRNKAGELRQALADAGFNVADNALSFDVSSQNGGQSQNPFFAFQDFGDRGQRAFTGRAFQAALTGEEDIVITPELLPGLKTAADSGLDIRI